MLKPLVTSSMAMGEMLVTHNHSMALVSSVPAFGAPKKLR